MLESNILWSRYITKGIARITSDCVEKGLKEYDVDLDTGSRRYDLRVTAIK